MKIEIEIHTCKNFMVHCLREKKALYACVHIDF